MPYSGTSYTPSVVLPRALPRQVIAEEGRLFSCINGTMGTGIAGAATTAFSSTAALLNVRSGAAGELVKNVNPIWLRIINTAVAASTTRIEACITMDTGSVRYSSGGSALAKINRNMNSSLTSGATVMFGALVLAAASGSARATSRFQLRADIMKQYEEFMILFGGDQNAGAPLAGSGAQRNVVDVGPHVLGPSQDLNLHVWMPSAAGAPSWEVEFLYEEI